MRRSRKLLLFVLILIVIYGVGVLGLLYPKTKDLFQALVPFNLIFSAIILFRFHRDWRLDFIALASGIFVAGILVEIIGVHTNLIFGEYWYGDTLGVKIAGVPVIIGLNWLLLVYCTGSMVYKLRAHKIIRAIIASALMVLIDFFIEPVAIEFNFWRWSTVDIPVQNYIAWFVISFIFLLFYYFTHFRKSNKIAPALYIILLVFFAVLNFFIH